MTVAVWSRNALEPRYIEGNLSDVVNDMNIAAASGKMFVIVQKVDGHPVAIETRNIITIDEVDDSDAFVGR